MTADGKKICKYLKRLKRGDRCFDELMECSIGYVGYVAYKNLVYKSFLGDVISETYRNVIRYVSTLELSGNPIAWLCRIAQNEAFKVNKREGKRNEQSIDEISESEAHTVDGSDKILEVVDLYRAIERLDETDRKIIESVFFECKPYREIAAELGIAVSDVTYRKKSALKKLLDFLSD